MKSVMISIQPKWCELIASGKKTIEVRKTRPKIDTPFKCYIYKTIERVEEIVEEYDSNFNLLRRKKTTKQWGGRVIGEFVCDRINRIGKRGINNNFDYCYLSLNEWGNDDIEIEITDIQKSCISKSELNAYGTNSSCLYAWHISDLKIYDKPREIGEFYSTKCDMPCEHKKRGFNMDFCMAYENGSHFCKELNCDKKRLTRPPQSWCYVEELIER